jgi:hypothetical protein
MSTNVYPGAAIPAKGYQIVNVNYDYRDVVENVIQKLAVLDNLFEFFQYTKNMTDFSTDTIPGLGNIIGDCISELKTVV